MVKSKTNQRKKRWEVYGDSLAAQLNDPLEGIDAITTPARPASHTMSKLWHERFGHPGRNKTKQIQAHVGEVARHDQYQYMSCGNTKVWCDGLLPSVLSLSEPLVCYEPPSDVMITSYVRFRVDGDPLICYEEVRVVIYCYGVACDTSPAPPELFSDTAPHPHDLYAGVLDTALLPPNRAWSPSWLSLVLLLACEVRRTIILATDLCGIRHTIMLIADPGGICDIIFARADLDEICYRAISTTDLGELYCKPYNLPDPLIPALPSYELTDLPTSCASTPPPPPHDSVLDWADAVHEHWLPDDPVVLVKLDDLRDDAEHRLGVFFCLAGIGLKVHHRESAFQDLVFIPVGMSFPDHLHGAFEQCYAIYPGWHAVPNCEVLKAAELQTLNQLQN
ncbi:uncharacterized protein UHOD_11306 [Ustilago sp. UG-2017b]|nr:uncharacterized protein UHOD_11306 [Ustilago sp. UG-2017b]